MNNFSDKPEKTSITITNELKSVIKKSTNHLIGIIYIILTKILSYFNIFTNCSF